jgi:epoxyqueuosine reductase
MAKTKKSYLRDLSERGWEGRIVPVERLADLKAAIEGRHEEGLLDETFYQERLSFFDFNLPQELPAASSIIIVAVPVPQVEALFHWEGKQVSAILPPTYAGYQALNERVREVVAKLLKEAGYRVAKTALPLKTLAACSGLGAYGRNNLCYVAGMGSFLQLVGLYADLPCSDDPWRQPPMLARCENCVACVRKCPTGAIAEDRFLLWAERCITFFNERQSDFPAWINRTWHNCLLGCMHCQSICPENKPKRSWVERACVFSEEETALLLEAASADRLPVGTLAKLKSLEITEDLGLLPRNLAALLNRKLAPA